MLFNSVEFILFFPVVVILYFIMPHKYRWIHLLAASCIFYMAFIPVYILILLYTILIDYIAGIQIESAPPEKKLRYLILSIVANIGILFTFKYYNFFSENLNLLLGFRLSSELLPHWKIILPVGLSFHTFQAMSYTIEVYRGNQKAERHLGIYALYVMFFPQLVAGPIERPQNLLHQFYEKHEFNYENAVLGLRQMLWGMFKKVVIADRLAIMVNQVYAHPREYEGIPLILACIFFGFQIYCDFSGYSDIAIGSARVMGFNLMQNFNYPFSARNITDYWRRWHISLTTWFNDYLYTPFAMRFRHLRKWGVILGVVLTFFLSGLWHGAAWTFVLYGCVHGLLVGSEMLTKKWRKKAWSIFPEVVSEKSGILLTYLVVIFSWVLFRASSIRDVLYIYSHLFKNIPGQIADIILNRNYSRLGLLYFHLDKWTFILGLLSIGILLAVESIERRKDQRLTSIIQQSPFIIRHGFYGAIMILIMVFGVFTKSQFIYFQF